MHANGYEIAYTYDALNRLKTQSGTLLDNQYFYDLGGNVVSFSESYGRQTDGTWNMQANYDAFDRLTSYTIIDNAVSYGESYTYDNNGNRLSDGSSVEKTERDLKKLFPKESWNKLHLQIIFYGREYCRAHTCKTPETMCPLCKLTNPNR